MQKNSFLMIFSMFMAFFMVTGCSRCTAQHDPSADRALFKKEADHANKTPQTLTADGKIPVEAGQAVQVDPITAKYNQFCASCHGAEGKADGAGAAALNPRPRNFSDKAWQSATDDARIIKVIREGGASVGLSPSMAAWGSVVSEEEAKGLVTKIRSFAN